MAMEPGRPSRNSKTNFDVEKLMSEDFVRVSFEIEREKRNALKAWCADNDTTIKDELTKLVDSLLKNK